MVCILCTRELPCYFHSRGMKYTPRISMFNVWPIRLSEPIYLSSFSRIPEQS
jgi:hypothetical protein